MNQITITFTLAWVILSGHPESARATDSAQESNSAVVRKITQTSAKQIGATAIGVTTSLTSLKPIPVFQSIRTFNQIKERDIHEVNHETLQDVFLTAYSLDVRSTGKTPASPDFGITFSGTRATVGRTVAVDPRIIPIGTPIYIEGIGWRIAEDTGGAVKGRHIDVLLSSEAAAIQFGVKRHVRVYVPLGDLESVMAISPDKS